MPMPIQKTIGSKIITLNDDERQPCEVWTRVMGYFRPVSDFNLGKKAEFNERKWFNEHNIQTYI